MGVGGVGKVFGFAVLGVRLRIWFLRLVFVVRCSELTFVLFGVNVCFVCRSSI